MTTKKKFSTPDRIFIPRPKDICKGNMHALGPDGKQQACLIGWASLSFDHHSTAYSEFVDSLREYITKKTKGVFTSIISYNDHPDTSPQAIAATYRKVAADFGYEIDPAVR